VTDFNLFYSGGSGGFLLLHLLLLSGRYHVVFENDVPMSQVIGQQWQISDHTKWKLNETWPSNSRTFQSVTALTKIYFYCGPEPDPGEYSSYNIGLYTDFDSQVQLSQFKRTHLSQVRNIQKIRDLRNLLANWQDHYNNVRDISWPDCDSFKKIHRLPAAIQKELLDNPYTQDFLNFTYKETGDFRDQQVILDVLPFLRSADAVIKLQDLVNTPAQSLGQIFGITHVNDQQQNLLDHWKNLHPLELLKSIGISTTRRHDEQFNSNTESTKTNGQESAY